MKILSIQIGKPQELNYNGQRILSGIIKKPIDSQVMMHKLHLEGDGQADLSVHGGEDKALYAYSVDTYEWWKKTRSLDQLEFGAMGENLSIDLLPEHKVFIGDIFQIGEVQVQVTEPRFPCYKLAAMYQDNNILKQFMQLNRSGIYFRVLQTGLLEKGMEFKLIGQEKTLVSIQEMFEFKNKPFDKLLAAKLLSIPSLNHKWREKLEKAMA